jgi:hypothetical protein
LDVLALPFDQYQRYRLVSDLIDEVREKKGEKLSILDVGGRTALLRAFMPSDRVTLVDLEASDERPLVLGDGSRLPFQDKTFDVVAAFDTLEHVPPKRRASFVAECARVSRRWVVIAGPYQSNDVEEAEKLLQRFLVDKLGVEHRYLEEHRHNGLPSRTETEKALEKAGFGVRSIGHGNLERWLALMSMALYMDYEPHLRPLAARVFRFYNQNLYASDHAAPVYRHAVVGAWNGAKLPRGGKGLDAAVAPRGVLERFREVADEIVCFDRARDDWREERERLKQTIDTLERDLSGHKTSLDESRRLESDQRIVIETLETDLDGHKRALETQQEQAAIVQADLQRDLDAHRALIREIERDLEAHRATKTALENEVETRKLVLETLEADLVGHRASLTEARATIAEQQASIEGLLTERESLRAHVTAIESALADHKLVLAERERDLSELRAVAAALEADLAGHRRALEERLRAVTALEAEIARHAREHADAVAALSKDLNEHKSVLAEVRQDLDGHKKLALDLRAEIGATRRARAELHDLLNQARQDIEGKRAEIARAADALRADDALIQALRVELKSRWRSFKRAFGAKRPTPGE